MNIVSKIMLTLLLGILSCSIIEPMEHIKACEVEKECTRTELQSEPGGL